MGLFPLFRLSCFLLFPAVLHHGGERRIDEGQPAHGRPEQVTADVQSQQQRKAEQDAAQSAVSKRLLEIEKKVSNVLPAAPGEVKDEKKTKELFGQLF